MSATPACRPPSTDLTPRSKGTYNDSCWEPLDGSTVSAGWPVDGRCFSWRVSPRASVLRADPGREPSPESSGTDDSARPDSVSDLDSAGGPSAGCSPSDRAPSAGGT